MKEENENLEILINRNEDLEKLDIEKDEDSEYVFVELEQELTLSDEVHLIDKNKRKKFLKKISTQLLLIVFTLSLSITVFSIISFCWVDKQAQKDVTKNLKNIGGIFYSDSNINQEHLDMMQEFIDDLPPSLYNALNDDWVVVLLDKEPIRLFQTSFITLKSYETTDMYIGGYTFTQSRTIFINKYLSKEIMYEVFVHEMGHFVSFENSSIHGSYSWEKLYKKNKNTFEMEPYSLSNEAEFFAACFELYYNNPQHLKSQSEEIYEFIDRIVEKEIRDDNFVESFFAGCKNCINTLRVYCNNFIIKHKTCNS